MTDPTPILTDDLRAEGWDVYDARDLPTDGSWEWRGDVSGDPYKVTAREFGSVIARRRQPTVEVPLDLLRAAEGIVSWSSWVNSSEHQALVKIIQQAEADQ